ncbi:hypothetical protein K443DRAFT_259359 [Laccaria amethystina LaAM-08-1]|uniref:Unplaced genomic scaffold K443scaffold_166, whole genome shotgun sequence n=1 Tax=Laccaria amethystina LaAM-08-1 TaxID=1095629 RepID=A0A0C9XHJ3_9AGAR|nr:hypothetical protein K443DRAFT_259359 [Laccaria amethystina LaAM-08-1]
MLTFQGRFNGYVVLYPLVTSSSFFSRCRCDLKNRVFGTTGRGRCTVTLKFARGNIEWKQDE